jgi:hypothetical protein
MSKEQNTNEDFIDFILSEEKYDGLTHPSVESEQKERDEADKLIEEREIDSFLW